MGKLTARQVATLKMAGRHSDGDNLYLNIDGESRSWVFMWKRVGRRREMGLGPVRDVSLAEARELARIARRQLREGLDPIAERKRPVEITFGTVADAYLEAHGQAFRNKRHRQQWQKALSDYCRPIRSVPVAEITTSHVLSVVEPIWASKSETASRLRGRIEKVLDYARAKGMRDGANPAIWRGHLSAILPPRKRLTRGHQPAMPFADVPSFVKQLRKRHATAALALRFAILTAGRSGEVLGAKWDEIDVSAALWTIPASRMKTKRLHRVPLSLAAVNILKECKALRTGDYLFPGQKSEKPLSEMALEMLMRRMGITDAVPHGFRSSFREWAGDATSFPRELAEAALSHVVGNAVEQAYRRGDAIAKRRLLMDAWALFVDEGSTVENRELYSKEIAGDEHSHSATLLS